MQETGGLGTLGQRARTASGVAVGRDQLHGREVRLVAADIPGDERQAVGGRVGADIGGWAVGRGRMRPAVSERSDVEPGPVQAWPSGATSFTDGK